MSDEHLAGQALNDNESQEAVPTAEEFKKMKELADNYKRRAEKAEASKATPIADPELANTVAALQADKESRELESKFTKISNQFLQEFPEFKGVADMDVVKKLHADSEDTVEEIAKRLYGKFTSKDTKGFESTKGNGESPNFDFDGMSPAEVRESRKDPAFNKAHSDALIEKLRKQL
tara:strand:- start:920 stop:1450 length:531 start_codon:yes stop_codon:yes gene_type:complete